MKIKVFPPFFEFNPSDTSNLFYACIIFIFTLSIKGKAKTKSIGYLF